MEFRYSEGDVLLWEVSADGGHHCVYGVLLEEDHGQSYLAVDVQRGFFPGPRGILRKSILGSVEFHDQ